MREIDLIRTLRGWEPASRLDAELSDAYKVGTKVTAKIRQRRKGAPHRLYWSALHKLVKHTAAGNDYPDAERLHKALLAATGFVEHCFDMRGRPIIIPSSTAFDAMDEAEAIEYRTRAFALIAERYGINIDDLFEEAARLTGTDPSNYGRAA